MQPQRVTMGSPQIKPEGAGLCSPRLLLKNPDPPHNLQGPFLPLLSLPPLWVDTPCCLIFPSFNNFCSLCYFPLLLFYSLTPCILWCHLLQEACPEFSVNFHWTFCENLNPSTILYNINYLFGDLCPPLAKKHFESRDHEILGQLTCQQCDPR